MTEEFLNRDTMGRNSPNCELESIYGHICVIHFHLLTMFGRKIANDETQNLINPNNLD